MNRAKSLTVACVLRSGGDFSPGYVHALERGVEKWAGEPVRFLCLTDTNVHGVETKNLVHGWPGWWSKMEVFALPGPLVYFDLDTVICGPLGALFAAVKRLPPGKLMMLDALNPKRERWCSGVMGWSGDVTWLYDRFREDPRGWMSRYRRKGDQEFLADSLRGRGQVPALVQKYAGVASWKWQCRANGRPPEGTSIVCFHGRPRPHEVLDDPWVLDNWALGGAE